MAFYNRGMRNVVLSLGISPDGYIARPDGAVDFLFMPKDFSMAEFMATIDTVIMGRKTLDVAMQMTGGTYKADMPTYVFSRSQPPASGTASNSSISHRHRSSNNFANAPARISG